MITYACVFPSDIGDDYYIALIYIEHGVNANRTSLAVGIALRDSLQCLHSIAATKWHKAILDYFYGIAKKLLPTCTL